ncbi:MAG: hypothetical protein SV760_01905, partial [Halobacteria archaeon]|nr:hypothetical protein [Halobacteria archaeon]
ARVKNVTFNKSFAAPDVITWDPIDNVTISITQRKNQTTGNYNNVTLKDLILKLNSLQADALRLSPNGRAYIYENYTNPSAGNSDGDKY